MFNLYKLHEIYIYKQSEITKYPKWIKLYNDLTQKFLNYNVEDIRTMTNIKIIETECILVDKIDETNRFLEEHVSRIEYDIIN